MNVFVYVLYVYPGMNICLTFVVSVSDRETYSRACNHGGGLIVTFNVRAWPCHSVTPPRWGERTNCFTSFSSHSQRAFVPAIFFLLKSSSS